MFASRGRCNGCGEERSLRYRLCWNCRLIPYAQRPLVREGREPPKPVCGCGRDYLTLTVEEMSQPCPHPKR